MELSRLRNRIGRGGHERALAAWVAIAASPLASPPCATDTAALRGLVGERICLRSTGAPPRSERRFLEYLAEDSVVLQPAPAPGRAFYCGPLWTMRTNSSGIPALADLAASDDLGFYGGTLDLHGRRQQPADLRPIS